MAVINIFLNTYSITISLISDQPININGKVKGQMGNDILYRYTILYFQY